MLYGKRTTHLGEAMMRRSWSFVCRLGVTTALAAAAWLSPFGQPSAHACKFLVCQSADVFPAGGDIPQDQLEFTFRPDREQYDQNDAGRPTPHLYRIEGDARSEIPLELTALAGYPPSFTVKPASALPAGSKLVLEADAPTCRPEARLEATFTVTEAAPAPTSLGTLKFALQRGLLEVGTRAGSCSETLDVAYADLTLELAAGALPFRSVLAYQWLVDGAPYDGFFHVLPHGDEGNGRSELGRGVERVYALCEPAASSRPESLLSRTAPGEHRVSLRGVLRGGATVETPEVHLELKCDGPAPVSSGADAGNKPVTVRAADLGGSTDTTTATAPRPAEQAPEPHASANGCSIVHQARSHAMPWWLGFAALGCTLIARRKRAP
jgi:hypothetical protein